MSEFNLGMVIPELTLKIHHIDGDMTAPWEYESTPMKVEFGIPLAFAAGMLLAYKDAKYIAVQGGNPSDLMRGIYIAAGENSEGLALEDSLSGEIDEAIMATKVKTIPVIRVHENMVLESISYASAVEKGARVYITQAVTADGTRKAFWETWLTDDPDPNRAQNPLFEVVDAQPMNEGDDLPIKLLLRYLGYIG